MSEFREGVAKRTAEQKAKDEARIAQLKAKGPLSQGEADELRTLLVGLPAEPETRDEERAPVYKALAELSEDQWKRAVDLLRQHNLV
jgi:hypothetical protein